MGIMSIRKVAQKLLGPVIITLIIALTVGMYIGYPYMAKDAISYRGKALELNGKVIKDSEFQGFINRATQQANQYAQYGMEFTAAQIRDTALSMAVNELAFEQEMAKFNSQIKVTDKEAESMINRYLPTEEELQRFMAQQGITNKKAFVKAVSEDIKRQKFIQLKARELKLTVPEDEVKEQLEQITVSHILVGLNDTEGKAIRSQAEALARANEVYNKAVADGDFVELVKQYSDDPGSKETGGVYGPMPLAQFKGSMVQEFSEGALALNEGEISKPVKTQFGYHVIRLDKREMPTGDDYTAKYKEAEDGLLLGKAQESPEFEKWLTALYEDAGEKATILDPGLRAYRLSGQEKWAEAAAAYEKAIKLKYYKKQWDVYLDAANVYLKLEQPASALEILEKVAADAQDTVKYQTVLATVYKENGQADRAEQILTDYSAKNPDDKLIHQQLKETFTKLEMAEAAEKEAALIAEIEKREQAQLEEYQRNLEQNQNQADTGQQTTNE